MCEKYLIQLMIFNDFTMRLNDLFNKYIKYFQMNKIL